MPACISLIKHTHQDITSIKEGPDRLGRNQGLLNRGRLGADGVLPPHGEDRCGAG